MTDRERLWIMVGAGVMRAMETGRTVEVHRGECPGPDDCQCHAAIRVEVVPGGTLAITFGRADDAREYAPSPGPVALA